MKKQGFTLTELLGVITVLGLIALIVFPNINRSIKNSKNKLYQRQIEFIEDNARRWGVDHNNLLPEENSYYLELNELVTGGYVSSKEIKDPRNEGSMNGCVVIAYDEDKNQYNYEYVEKSCSEAKPVCPTYEIMGKTIQTCEITTLDPDKNPRYVGKNPNNYVRFNNELWRIIGVFNGQVKLIRNEVYSENIQWGSKSSGDQEWGPVLQSNIKVASGNNNWSTATLKEELNVTYLNSIDSTYKAMIDESHVWKLGGIKSMTESLGKMIVQNRLDGYFRINLYNQERGTEVYEGRPTEWTGAIGLMYPSDYGYSTSSKNKECDETMGRWGSSENLDGSESKLRLSCRNNSWLYNPSYGQWTISPYSGDQNSVFVIDIDGSIFLTHSRNHGAATPVLYLKPTVKITEGDGSTKNPFGLVLEA